MGLKEIGGVLKWVLRRQEGTIKMDHKEIRGRY
jgi:hypothetical protein